MMNLEHVLDPAAADPVWLIVAVQGRRLTASQNLIDEFDLTDIPIHTPLTLPKPHIRSQGPVPHFHAPGSPSNRHPSLPNEPMITLARHR